MLTPEDRGTATRLISGHLSGRCDGSSSGCHVFRINPKDVAFLPIDVGRRFHRKAFTGGIFGYRKDAGRQSLACAFI